MTTYKRDRPTVGVLAGWQMYWGSLDSFFAPLIRSIYLAARDRDCNLLMACGLGHALAPTIRPAWPVASSETDFVPVGPWNTDGLIAITPLLSESRSHDLQTFIARGHPIVFIGAGEKGPAVIPDNAGGIKQAMAHLVAHGHRQIALIADLPGAHADSLIRLQAFQSAILEYGLEAHPNLIAHAPQVVSGGYQAMQQILNSGTPFTAVIGSNDEAALGAMNALREAGRRVPEDIAVIGFDNLSEGVTHVPPLTTLDYPNTQIGRRALELVLDQIEGRLTDSIVHVPTELIVRHSCGCRPAAAGHWLPVADALDQAQLIQAMGRAVLVNTRQINLAETTAFCQALVEGFMTSLAQGDKTSFLTALEKILMSLDQKNIQVQPWQAVLSVLAGVLPQLSQTPTQRLSPVELRNMLDEARVAMVDAAQRQLNRTISERAWLSERLGWLTARLLTAATEADILQTLEEALPGVGVPPAELGLFEPEASEPTEWCRLRSSNSSKAMPARSLARAFPPAGVYPSDRPFHLVLLPLVFRDEPLGFVAFDAAHVELCGTLSHQLAAALKGEQLHAAERRHAQEMAQAYQALKEHQAKLLASEKMASLGRLTAGIAHEMNTPLAAVRMALDQLENLIQEYLTSLQDTQVTLEDHQEIGQEMGQALRLARASAERAASFVRGIKAQTRDLAPHEQIQFNAVPVIEETLLLLGPALRQGKCTATFEASNKTIELFGSPGRLGQIVTNLVVNAVEASAPQGGPIIVQLQRQPNEIQLQISDRGGGIAPDILSKIFDPLFTTKPFGEGTGLGLTIVHNIVTGTFGGQIKVESRLEQGTTFTLHFPLPGEMPSI